jgi:hypothetical protein
VITVSAQGDNRLNPRASQVFIVISIQEDHRERDRTNCPTFDEVIARIAAGLRRRATGHHHHDDERSIRCAVSAINPSLKRK